MDRKVVLAFTAGVAVTFVIEEILLYSFVKEAKDRMNDQSIALASLGERIEMLES